MTYETYRARHEAKKEAKNIKLPLSVVAVILIFTLLVGGTVAFLATRTDQVENTFVPATVTSEVTENTTPNSKDNIQIKNTGDIKAYVRAYVIFNWLKEDGSVCGGSHSDFALPALGQGWTQAVSGIYYYADPVAPGASTPALFNGEIALTEASDGCKLQVEIVASAIQAEGTGATNAMDAWSQTPGSGN